MKEKKTLWIISELFYPEETSTGYIMTEIANAMTEKYDVKVICGPEVYDDKRMHVQSPANQLNPSIELQRVKGIKENKEKVLSRIRKFIVISKRLFLIARNCIVEGDIVLMASNPFPLILSMAKLRKRRAFRWVILVHDVFPEGLITRFHIMGLIAGWVKNKFNRAYSQADTLISLGRDMGDLLNRKTKGETSIVQIENWADLENIHPLSTVSRDYIVLQYAGNIGRAQGIPQIVDFIKEARNPRLKLDIWGSGSMEGALRLKVKNDGLSNVVSFRGTFLREQQEQVLNACDLAIVPLSADMYGRGVPSKTYNILAAGKPILYIGPKGSEIGMMVEEEEIGFSFANEDKDDIVHLLKSLKPEMLLGMGAKARGLAERRYSKQAILQKFKAVL